MSSVAERNQNDALRFQLRNALDSIGVNALVRSNDRFLEVRLPVFAVEQLLTFIHTEPEEEEEGEE